MGGEYRGGGYEGYKMDHKIDEINWEKLAPYFKREEFACKHTGECRMRLKFMDKLLALRKIYNRPMVITSGYRHPTHPIEAKKKAPGEHTMGMAADIACDGGQAFIIVKEAILLGFTRVGVSQRAGVGRYVHIGLGGEGLPEPRIWSY